MASTLTFECPHCGKSLKGNSEHVGRRSKCPGCGEPVIVPGAQSIPLGSANGGAAGFASLLNSMTSAGGSNLATLFNHLTSTGAQTYAQVLNQAASGEVTQFSTWLNTATEQEVQHAATLLNDGKITDALDLAASKGAPATSATATYKNAADGAHDSSATAVDTCGTCGKTVVVQAPDQSTSPDELPRHAVYCSACDDIFCMGCGMKGMSSGGSVPCARCGGPSVTITEDRHPTWYPGQRPTNHLAVRQPVTVEAIAEEMDLTNFAGDIEHYRVIHRVGRAFSAEAQRLRAAGVDGVQFHFQLLTGKWSGPNPWEDYPFRNTRLSLRGANLAGCTFVSTGNYFEGADLRGAKLDNTYFMGASLKKAELSDASLRNASMFSVDLDAANLSNADLRNARIIIYTRSEPVNLSDANLEGARVCCDQLRATFTNTRLQGCSFAKANRNESLNTDFLKELTEEQKGQITVEKSSQCFIATAACGDDQADLVLVLRAFLDEILSSKSAGRSFIRHYQRFSPPIASWIEKRPLSQYVVRVTVVRPAAVVARYFLRSL